MKNSETRIKLHHYLSRCLIIIVSSACLSVMADSGCWWESDSSSREVCHIFQKEEFNQLTIDQQKELEDDVLHLVTLAQNGKVVDVESMIEKRPILLHIPIKIDRDFRGGVAPLLARYAHELISAESREAFRIILEAGASLINWDNDGNPYYFGALLHLYTSAYFQGENSQEDLMQEFFSTSGNTPNLMVLADKKNIQRIKDYPRQAGSLMAVREESLSHLLDTKYPEEWFLEFFKNHPENFLRIVERSFKQVESILPYTHLNYLAGKIPLLVLGNQANFLHFIAGYKEQARTRLL